MAEKHIPVVATAGLTKIFRDFWHRPRVVAVDKLNMEIYQNEVFGLLGPNGSGKTTTIKMLLGLLYPTRGRINILGQTPTDVEVKNRIGYLPEESYLYRFLNARETLEYYAQLFKIPRSERKRRVEQLLEMVGLSRESRRRVGEYSKGMARRIGLAQALINDPDLLILDEPTTGLDPIGTREIKDLIAYLNKEKRKTIILCSHLLADVEDVCQRVAVLYGGKCQALGYVHDLLRRENLTQITTERLSDATLNRIREILQQEEHKDLLEVTSPSDKLESFFLRIVREAQHARQSTSGVTSGGRIAEFLGTASDEGDQLVQSLITAAQSKPAAEQEAAPVAEETPTEHKVVIEELISGASATTQSEKPQPPTSATEPASPQKDEAVDRGVIDDLLGGGQKRTDRQDQDQTNRPGEA